MKHLVLIRHSQSQPSKDVSAHQWELTDRGRQLCKTLAEQLNAYGIERIFSSTEPKAFDTARIVADCLQLEPPSKAIGLEETWRHTVPFYENPNDFRNAVKLAMDAPDEITFGEESFNAARDRFTDVLSTLIEKTDGKSLAVVSHGTVLSLFLSRACSLDCYKLWRSLRMPAYAVLDLAEMNLVELREKI